ncbi:DUF2892 domain-containing protein [Halostella litorea]|uniref:DUF2892 domain-containing protein n=1 Tax=Halostella litorea TaxID=2528831 RepID=UPI001092A3D2|nr:DUF2892 domain-containing protein [Halostella litorea]
MGFTAYYDDHEELVQTGLAVVLAIVAISSFRKGKRLRGLLAGLGAIGVSYRMQGESETLGETFDISSSETGSPGDESGEGELTCAACGEPIHVGQGRGPNENDEIVHDTCKQPSE